MIKDALLATGLTATVLSTQTFAHRDNAHQMIPKLDHVFMIMMENHSYSGILNNSDAPFINQLAKTANLATNYFAVGHPSLTNYLEVLGGSNFGIVNDNYPNWHNATANASLNDPIGGTGMDVATPAAIAALRHRYSCDAFYWYDHRRSAGTGAHDLEDLSGEPAHERRY